MITLRKYMLLLLLVGMICTGCNDVSDEPSYGTAASGGSGGGTGGGGGGSDVATRGAIASAALSIAHGGTGYIVGEEITVIQAGAVGGVLEVDTVDSSGTILNAHVKRQGSGYSAAANLSTIAQYDGTGATVNIVEVDKRGVMFGISILYGAAGLVGQTLTVEQPCNANVPGSYTNSSGVRVNGSGKIHVDSLYYGDPNQYLVHIVNCGHDYKVEQHLKVTTGEGGNDSGAMIDIDEIALNELKSVCLLGSGAKVNITTTDGAITGISIYQDSVTHIYARGTGYAPGDIIKIVQGANKTAIAQVDTVNSRIADSGGILTLSIVNVGSGYFDGTQLATETPDVSASEGGSGYHEDDLLTVIQEGAASGTIRVNSIDSSGTILEASIESGGMGYSTQTIIPSSNISGGHGTGAKIRITGISNQFSGQISTISIHGGYGYTVGDVLTVVQTGGTSGTIRVDSTDVFGTILSFHVVSGGSGYAVESNLPLSGGTGLGATINIASIS